MELSAVEGCLDEWLLEQENYDVALALRPIALRWTAPAMPEIRELVAPGPASLAYHFSRLDPRLNPGLRQLMDAQLALHAVRPCLYGCKLADRLAQENGKLLSWRCRNIVSSYSITKSGWQLPRRLVSIVACFKFVGALN